MSRSIRSCFVMISVFMIVSARVSYAQKINGSREPGQYELQVEEALNEVEVGIEHGRKEPTLTEPVISGDSKIETDVNIPVEVEVLEDIVVGDQSEAGGRIETKVIPLLHAEASGIMDTLLQMKSPEGEVMYNEADSTLILKDASKQLEAMSEYVKKVDILLETEVFELKYAAAKDIIEKVKEVLTKNVGQIQLDEQANSIVATDTPLTIGKIKELIASLDFLNREIRIESKVLQIILNDEHETGVDWEAIVSGFQDMDFAGFTFKTDAKEERKLSIGSVSREDYKILLEALDTVGVVNNVSDEIIKIENENTGMLNVLSELAREIERSGSNADEGDHRDPEEKVQFHLTPVIDRNGMITVSILPDHIDKNTGGSTRTPGSSAAVQIKDGETIVIGSLFEEAMVESMWKIPLLGDLPLLGFVFRNQGEEPRKAEVVTFLTVKTVEKKSKK